ncbi:pyridoxamine 5'-phosphate oxidase family protein [Microbacterium sp.]|uniref:pyridoxamine 5'-phosphate oxidase family protein n=1 Tax=Microbacterium sp. TaxID=51671 RepID=UPI001AC78A5B|nr:pyridoxamine 5'-phosphate oxidase family protein [Microbacterium sp.]MBN9189431.1 pyridoxamine 5'-phosphate oxidase family protein [Microbacterium sp.]MBN9192534.1 pyridoxamine 5'-phosphate oxidase family protein [Microbacterium sp.]
MTDELEIVRTILKSARTASVTTQTASGALHSRPLAVLDDDFAGTLWFFTADPSSKTADLAAHPQVNVSVGDGKGWLSLSGVATISRDEERIDRYWNPWAAAYFEGGRDDPTVALLQVDVSSIHYWDLDKPAIVTAFEVAKGLLTRSAPDVGDNGVIQLH